MDTRPYLHRVQDQPWSFNGPDRAPKMDLMILEKISGFFRKFRAFLYFTFSRRPWMNLRDEEGIFSEEKYEGEGWLF